MKPIAWYDPTNGAISADKDSLLFTPLGQVLPLYPEGEWVGLTDAEIQKCYSEAYKITNGRRLEVSFARAIEAIKEALAQPELCKYGNEVQGCTSSPMNCQCCFDSLDDLDDEPAQRPWVGLTDEEIHDTEGYKETREIYRLCRAIEAKLKEKNT
jgi:hypothetical protein